jgi:hypothetical protein
MDVLWAGTPMITLPGKSSQTGNVFLLKGEIILYGYLVYTIINLAIF